MASHGVTVKVVADARKEAMGRVEALALARGATKVLAAKGKSRVQIWPASSTDEELAAAILGPTGNLRAPAILRGKTLLIGFHEDMYTEVLK